MKFLELWARNIRLFIGWKSKSRPNLSICPLDLEIMSKIPLQGCRVSCSIEQNWKKNVRLFLFSCWFALSGRNNLKGGTWLEAQIIQLEHFPKLHYPKFSGIFCLNFQQYQLQLLMTKGGLLMQRITTSILSQIALSKIYEWFHI